MTAADVERIRDEMERAEARRLQPHFIRSFFLEAFALLGGGRARARAGPLRDHPRARRAASSRPPDRHGRSAAPQVRAGHLRQGASSRSPVDPLAAVRRPGHPLLDATIDLIIERYDSLLQPGRRPGRRDRRRRRAAGARVPRARRRRRPHRRRRQPSGRLQDDSSSSTSIPTAPPGTPAGRRTSTAARPTPEEIELLDAGDRGGLGASDLESKALDHGVELRSGPPRRGPPADARSRRSHHCCRPGAAAVGDQALGPPGQPAEGP